MHSGNLVNGLGRIMHLPLACALSRPRPLTRLPLCIKTRNTLHSGIEIYGVLTIGNVEDPPPPQPSPEEALL